MLDVQTHSHASQIDDAYRQVLTFIQPEERVLWMGKPVTGAELPASVSGQILVAKICMAVFVMMGLLTYYWGFRTGVLLSVAGTTVAVLMLIVGAVQKEQIRLFVTYVLTDKRAFRLLHDNELSILMSVPLLTTTTVEAQLRGPKPVSIRFRRQHRIQPNFSRLVRILPVQKRVSWLSFDGVEYPQYVLQVAQWAAAQNYEDAA